MRIFNKIICLVLIQMFFINNICFAFDDFIERDNLAPVVNVSSSDMLSLFASIVDLEKDLNRTDNGIAALSKVDNLNQGYEQLKKLITDSAPKKMKALIVCIDGATGVGKTTFTNLIKAKGLGDISVEEIEFLSRDKIFWDLLEDDDLTFHDARLELPIAIGDKIYSSDAEKKVIIVEGADSYYMLKDELGIVPDIGIIIESSNIVRFKRNIIRNGFIVGLKQFLDSEYLRNIIGPVKTLKVENNEGNRSWPYFFIASLWRTMTIFVEYLMPQSVVDIYSKTRDAFLDKASLLKIKISWIDLIFSPLRLMVCAINTLLDFYYFIYADYDMVKIIKKRFGDKIVQVLDVGTGNGEFIKRFQSVLNKKGIDAIIQGTDNKAAAIVKARENKVTVRAMDISEMELKFGENRFDIITINAPDSPEGCVDQAMRVLKPEGFIVLRAVKPPFSYKLDRAEMIERLSLNYDVQVLDRKIHNLPNGFYYKLQNPLIIRHKATAESKKPKNLEFAKWGSNGNIVGINSNWQKRQKGVEGLIRVGDLFEASRLFSSIRVKNEIMEKTRDALVSALKVAADESFDQTDYNTARAYYEKVLEIAPHETDSNFYIGACYLMEQDFEKARKYILRAKKGQPRSPLYVLAVYIMQTNDMADKIQGFDLSSISREDARVLLAYNKLGESVNYVFEYYGGVLSDFFDQSDANNAIFQTLLQFYQANLERIEEKLSEYDAKTKRFLGINLRVVPSKAKKEKNARKVDSMLKKIKAYVSVNANIALEGSI